jgi:hypothetical protein
MKQDLDCMLSEEEAQISVFQSISMVVVAISGGPLS